MFMWVLFSLQSEVVHFADFLIVYPPPTLKKKIIDRIFMPSLS